MAADHIAVNLELDEDATEELAALATIAGKLLPDTVREFCQRNKLLHELREAADLARKHFRASTLSFEIDTDQETGDKSVLITVPASVGSREEALNSYFGYTKELVATVPWPQRGLIRLSYSLL